MMVSSTIGIAFGIIMVVLYLILGTTFIIYAPEHIPEEYARPFGLLLIAYGVFRAYKYYRKYIAR